MESFRKMLLCSLALVSPFTLAEQLAQEEQKYVDRYVTAVNSKNLSALKSLSHPSYLNCISDENQDFFDSLFQKDLERNIPPDYKVSFSKLTVDNAKTEREGASKIGLPYPVLPTHDMQIDFAKSEYSFVTIHRKLILESGEFYQVGGCPEVHILERYRVMQKRRKEDLLTAKKLLGELTEEQRSRFTILLTEGKRIEAWKGYSKEANISIGMAKLVLEQLIETND
ncbi:exported hypothetical protein [Vibrio coralliirubri]|uniref:hypothetical protein n=1 Tax=Vibrio coralliirubri TaxID=1516159 RepID=UPI0006374EAC|nr:hypothetical protein [Vibrio coralliirubri]CDT33671.1 exported hypothetical protein [Vibrio coralliirubri]